MRRSGLDYMKKVNLAEHSNWEAFESTHAKARKVLLTTKSHRSFIDFSFEVNDILIFGRESAGVPEKIHQGVEHRITIPMKHGFRSLNVAVAAAIVLGEALRQVNAFPLRTVSRTM